MNPRLTAFLATAFLSVGLAYSSAAEAQATNGTLLVGKDVTEQNVLEALTPDSPQIRTRGLTSSPRETRKRPTASLLVTFDTNSTKLTQQSKESLDVVAAALKNERLRDFVFELEGHADARGSAAANLVLSQKRAEIARAYLVAEHGIPESRLRAVGKGDLEPLNLQNVAAPENRRLGVTTVTP